jgi:predicted nucleotidyltransferase
MSLATRMSRHGITLPADRIAEFCRRWKIRQLAVFGSYLRDDFTPESDLDFLYTFARDAAWGLEDLGPMEQDLAAVVGRSVDLVSRSSVERSSNAIRRQHILETAEPIYEE